MAAIPPPAPPRNPTARWFQVGGAIFSGIGCFSLLGAAVLIGGVNAIMPSDAPPAGSTGAGQDVYSIVTAPFRAFRWLIDQVSPVLVFVSLAPLVLGILFLIVGQGIARYRRWARVVGAMLLLISALLGALTVSGAIIDGEYEVASCALPFALLPLYPFWLLVWKWGANIPSTNGSAPKGEP